MRSPLRLLLVEDEALNRALVRAILERRRGELPPFELEETGTIEGARRALAGGDVDILLLDVRLPDGSGLELARDLHDGAPDERGGRPVVAILSASVLALERVAAEAAGADAFLGKPFVPAELTALVQRLAAMARARDAAGSPSGNGVRNGHEPRTVDEPRNAVEPGGLPDGDVPAGEGTGRAG